MSTSSSDWCTYYTPDVAGTVPPTIAAINNVILFWIIVAGAVAVVWAVRQRQSRWLAVPPLIVLFLVIGGVVTALAVPFELWQASTCAVKGDTVTKPTVLWPHYASALMMFAAPLFALIAVILFNRGEWRHM